MWDRFLIALGIDFEANLAPTWPQLGPQIHPKIHPRATKNRSQIASYFWSVFWSIFHWFFIDFRCQNQPKIYQKSIPKSSQEHINKKLKTSILYCNLQYIRALGYVMLCTKLKKKWYRNPFKNSSQINTKLGSILHPTWLHFGRFLEVKMEPNSLQDVFKMQSFFHSFFDIVFYRFLSQLGPNLAPTWPQLGPQIHPKTHPRAIKNRSQIASYFWSVFWSIFHQFCIDFRPQTGLIFIDFWLIFWLIFHEFWSSLWLTFHRLWKDSGTHLASF